MKILIARARAFTMTELLVVMVIMALLVGLLLPVLGRSREEARLTQCRSNLRQIGVALTLYAGDNAGYSPAVYGWTQEDMSGAGYGVQYHQTDGFFSQGTLSQRTHPNSPERARGLDFIATGLGLAFQGGYLTMKGGTILTCPAYPAHLTFLGPDREALDRKYNYDADEPFWSSPRIIPSADGDRVQDIYAYDPADAVTRDWHVGTVMTGYWLRQEGTFATSVLRPQWSSWNLKEARFSQIAIASDMCGARSGYNSYYHVDLTNAASPVLRDTFPLFDTATYPTEAARVRFQNFYIENHAQGYNVLFADGSVRFFADGGQAL
ncbi:MAG: DUF1559 domain-containing protein, partial [Planctomycetota bacterium]